MSNKRRTAAIVAAWTTIGVVGVAALTGVALADPTPAPGPTTASSTPAAGGDATGRPGLAQLRRLGGRVLHGELVVRTKDGDKTVDTQLGVVSVVTPTSLDVKSSDGYTQIWVIDSSTRVRSGKKAGTDADLVVGATVRLLGQSNGHSATVAVAVVRPS